MLSRHIYVSPHISVRGSLKLFISSAIYVQMTKQGLDGQAVAKQLSAQSLVLLYPQGTDDNRYYVLVTEHGMFFVNYIPEHQNMSANKFMRDNPVLRNVALREGLIFKLSTPLYVSVQSQVGFNNFHGGNNTHHSGTVSCATTIAEIERAYAEKANNGEQPTVETETAVTEEPTISAELDALLTTATQYADLDHEMAKLKAAKRGNIHYSGVEGGKGDAKEETCLRFLFGSYDKIDDLRAEMVVNIPDKDGNILGAEITAISDPESDKVFLELTFPTAVDMSKIPGSGNITLSVSPNVRDTQLAAIEKIRTQPEMTARFERILGQGKPAESEHLDSEEREQLLNDFRNRKYPLTQTQAEAVLNGIRAQDAYLVMGPPGTGKTTVILEWVKYFALKKHKRVLIASQNNTAVDNVLKRLADVPEFNLLRLGRAAKVAPELEAMQFKNKVTSAREDIVAHVQRKQEELRKLYTEWSDIYTGLVEKLHAPPEQAQFDKSFNGFLKNLAERFDTILKAVEESKELREKLLKQARSLSNLRKGAGGWAFLPAPLRQSLFTFRRRAFDEARTREKQLCDTINVMIQRYNQYSQTLYAERFVAYNEAVREFEAKTEQLQNLCDKSNAFFPLKPEQFRVVKSSQRLTPVTNTILEGLRRVQAVSKQLAKWQRDVANAQNYALRNLVLENVNVVGATCISSSNKPFFSELPYDVVILDEAGQIQIHNCLVPMTRAEKVIMLGDHKQLPPTADRELLEVLQKNGHDPFLYRNSLFEKLYGMFSDEHKMMLDTQFRIPKGVADFLSGEFYEGQYKTHPNKAAERHTIDFLGNAPLVLIDTSDCADRFHQELQVGNQSIVWNEYESRIAAAIYRKLQQAPYKTWETKVLAGLARQVKAIRDALGDAARGAVSTVDSFQGQECDVVIYSFTRSESTTGDDSTLNVGFLSDLRRLNVAMSRSKKVLVVIGDFSYLDACREMLERSSHKNRRFATFIRRLKAATNRADGDLPTACLLRSQDVLRRTEEHTV